ncbi:hypothetical protein MKX03_031459 [Papaver bracteatum]|nr:hypothetical protein MKX03_031459 [Papaver bracteatum]
MLLIFILLLFSSLQNLVTSSDQDFADLYCPGISSCDEDHYRNFDSLYPMIHYPFSIAGDNNHGKDCVYPPGFELSCRRNRNETILKLPFSGEFYVRGINYDAREIQVSDPGGCLPRRYLQNVNLSGTPFEMEEFETYVFSNCSTEGYSNLTKTYEKNSISMFHPIDCLSSSTHKVLATVSRNNMRSVMDSMNSSNCQLIDKNVVAQAQWKDYWSPGGDFDALTDKVLYLTWHLPDLKQRRDLSKGMYCLLIIGTGLPILIGIIWCCRYEFTAYSRNDRTNQTQTELPVSVQAPPRTVTGLDESTIQSYPQMVLCESRKLLNPENTVCSICLSDYKPKDTLKSIPECNHYFHVDCIDGWLRVKGSCPVCRKSPL